MRSHAGVVDSVQAHKGEGKGERERLGRSRDHLAYVVNLGYNIDQCCEV